VDSISGYFVDLTTKTRSSLAAKPDSLPPAALAQLALGWWERSLAGQPEAERAFEQICELLARRAQPAEDGLRWPYHVAVRKYGLRSPWFSAMAQGQIGSVFVRAHVLSGDDRWRELGVGAVQPLLVERETDLVSFTADGPILEEVPGLPRSHVLNGWVYALWGLRDVGAAWPETQAEARFHESATRLASMLGRYDVGWWTRYSLYPHPLADLAKPFYHRLHATQMEVLALLTRQREFEVTAERWRNYDTQINLARALGQKLVFKAALEARRL
jgi:hypothetical protein